MVEENILQKDGYPERVKPSEVRDGAGLYEVVRVEYPKTGKSGHFLYWWHKKNKEVILEQINESGERIDHKPVKKYGAESLKEADRKITDDINTQSKRGLRISRHLPLDRKLFEKARIKQGMLISYYEELIRASGDNLTEAKWDYDNAVRKVREKKEATRQHAKVYRKSVYGGLPPSDLLEKREKDFETAMDEYYPDLGFYNEYLNERVGVDEPVEKGGSLYARYVESNEELSDLNKLIRKSRLLEEKYKLVKKYEEVFNVRLLLNNKLAEERGYAPLKGIPEDYPLGEGSKEEGVKVETAEVKEKQVLSAEERSNGGKANGKPLEDEKPESEVRVPGQSEPIENVSEETEPQRPDTEMAKPTLLENIAAQIKENGVFREDLGESQLSEIFQTTLNGLISEGKSVKGEVTVSSLSIGKDSLSLEAKSLIKEPFEVGLAVEYEMSRTTEIGKLAQKRLEIKVEPGSKLSLGQKIKLEVAQLSLRSKLMKPMETLMEGLNYEFLRKNLGVRASDIRIELKDKIAELSVSGELIV